MPDAPKRRRGTWIALFLGSVLIGIIHFFRAVSGDLLIETTRSEHLTCARLLVLLGADPNSRMQDDSGRGPLHLAAALGDADMIRLLIRHGATVDLLATFQVTPRAEAQMAHQAEAERVLVEYGARPVPPHLHVP